MKWFWIQKSVLKALNPDLNAGSMVITTRTHSLFCVLKTYATCAASEIHVALWAGVCGEGYFAEVANGILHAKRDGVGFVVES